MLHFLVLVAKPGSGTPPAALVEIARDEDARAGRDVWGHTHWKSTSGSVQFAGWHDGRPPEPWLTTPVGLVAHGGEALDLRSAAEISRGSLLEALARSGAADLLPSLEGIYALVELMADGGGGIVTDPFGIHTIYTGETPTTRVFANDAHLVARCLAGETGTPPSPDTQAMAMVVAFGSVPGERTPYLGVETLPFGVGIEIDAGTGRVRTTKARPDPWSVPRVGRLTDKMVDGVADRMARLVRAAVRQHPDEPLSELTAGKDSRLVLAMAKHAGLLDQITFFTRGGDTPDFEGAWAVAERLGLTFRRARWAVPPEGWVEPYREHVARVSGQLGAWDSSESRDHRGATFSGLLGETLRASAPNLLGIDRPRQVVKKFERIVRQRAGPLRAEVLDDTARRLAALFAEPLGEGFAPSELADIFYVRHHQHRFLGAQPDRHDRYFYPLYARGASETAFALGPQARLDETLRRALMARAGLPLEDLEFAKVDPTAHPPVIVETRPDLRPVDLTRAGMPALRKSGKDITRAEALRQLTRALDDSAAYEIVDRAALRRLVDHYESMSRLDQIKAHKAITPIIWMDQLDHG